MITSIIIFWIQKLLIAKEPCPHCGGLSWYEREGREVWQRCVCGLLKLVISENDGVVVIHTLPGSKITMPRRGSALSLCLGMLISIHPTRATTRDVSSRMGCDSPDIANRLMVLMHKGLVDRVEARRGLPGGSTWKLSHWTIAKLKLSHGGN